MYNAIIQINTACSHTMCWSYFEAYIDNDNAEYIVKVIATPIIALSHSHYHSFPECTVGYNQTDLCVCVFLSLYFDQLIFCAIFQISCAVKGLNTI